MAKELKDLTKSDVFSTLNPTPTLTSATEPPHYPYSEERKEKNKRWLKLALLTLLGFIVLGGTLRLWEPWVERFDLDEISCMCDKNVNDYVDLGLSVKWATCNVGASSPSDDGDYFAWGETSPKPIFTEKNNKTSGKKLIGDIAGNPNYDAARANWGGSWRLPTEYEFSELRNNCTWIWTNQGGTSGYTVMGKNGNSIFLSAAGGYDGKANSPIVYGDGDGVSLLYVGKSGYYWCSTPCGSPGSENVFFMGFSRSDYSTNWAGIRYNGYSVRPVSE